MRRTLGQQATATNVTVTEVKRAHDPEVLAAHVLEPGDAVWWLNEAGMEPLGWGIVCKSDRNNAASVEARIGEQPIKLYARWQLRWMGPLEE